MPNIGYKKILHLKIYIRYKNDPLVLIVLIILKIVLAVYQKYYVVYTKSVYYRHYYV